MADLEQRILSVMRSSPGEHTTLDIQRMVLDQYGEEYSLDRIRRRMESLKRYDIVSRRDSTEGTCCSFRNIYALKEVGP